MANFSHHILLLTFLLTAFHHPVQSSSVPLLFCVNERADHAECQDELASARLSILPWFGDYGRRKLLDCGRFCPRHKDTSHLTFQLPCQCNEYDDISNARKIALKTPGPLEGPIQMFHSFVETLSDGRCKENLAEMDCFITFVSSYETSLHSNSGGFHFVDQSDSAGSAPATPPSSPIAAVAAPTDSPVHPNTNYDISFDDPDELDPKYPEDPEPKPVAGEGNNNL